jgi:hypothetical protein
MTLVLALVSTAPVFASNPLATKVHELIDKGKAIRMKLTSIASRGQGINGWDKFSNAVDRVNETISNVESKVESLTTRMSELQLPFPNNLGIPGHQVRILGRSASFPGLTAPFPTFNRLFPRVNEFLQKVLDPADNALDKALALVTEIDDSMAAATIFAPTGGYSPMNSVFPTANYLDGANVRNGWFGKAGSQRFVKAANEVVAGLADAVNKVFDQEVVFAAGGNLATAGAIVEVIKGAMATFKEIVDDIGGDGTSSEVTASYHRLEFIHNQVDTLDEKVDVLDGKVTVVDGKVTVLTSEFRDYRTLSIRTRIEINLSGHGDHPSPIAIFMLPAQFGGYLEVARDIVQSTIANMIAAGQNVYQATMWLTRGNSEFAAGRYKKAYEFYTNSYAEATK